MRFKMIPFGILISLLFINCKESIKNTDITVEIEAGTEIVETSKTTSKPIKKELIPTPYDFLLGTYVGDFRSAKDEDGDGFSDDTLWIDEGLMWSRANKINISIDSIIDQQLFGHSVVAGNSQFFKGDFFQVENSRIINAQLKEPGNHKYDGVFKIKATENQMEGTWVAYGDIEIKNRIFNLEKKIFEYIPDAQLSENTFYADWEKTKTEKVNYGDEVDEEWYEYEKLFTATDIIYEINASNQKLTKSDVENLGKGDIKIIRNAVFARHGYSFKNKALRKFFDEQEWYIPIYTDVRDNLTLLEKENISLLLKYEKNATEYYDTFGRG